MTVTLVKKLTAGVVPAVAIVGGSGSALAQKEVAGSQTITIDPVMTAGQWLGGGLKRMARIMAICAIGTAV
jgi:hypothetical protein